MKIIYLYFEILYFYFYKNILLTIKKKNIKIITHKKSFFYRIVIKNRLIKKILFNLIKFFSIC